MLAGTPPFTPQTRDAWTAEARRTLGDRSVESLRWEVEPGIVLEPIYFPDDSTPLDVPTAPARPAAVVQFFSRWDDAASLDGAEAVYVETGDAPTHTGLDLLAPPTWGDLSTGLDGLTLREAGATRVETLAWLLAQRAAAPSATPLRVTTGVGPEWIAEIAFLRALRHLFEDADLHLLVLTLRYFHTAAAPHTNLLRNTLAASAALVGGADALCVRPHDSLSGTTENGRRLARQTHLLLRDESHLGSLLDPARGAYAVEVLTQQFVEAARARHDEIERGGGFSTCHDADLAERVAAQHRARQAQVLSGKARIVGVTRSPDPADVVPEIAPEAAGTSLAPRRLATPFETLRAAARKNAPVCLYLFGDRAQASARAGFSREFFGTAGLSTVDVHEIDAIPAGAAAVVVCAADADYDATGADVLTALGKKTPGVPIGVAGKPASEGALREAGAAFFIHARAPLYPHLRDTLALLHLLD